MASHKSVGLEFFKKNRPDQSAGDKIIFISLVAMVVFQSEDLKTYVLADGLHEKNMICSDDFDDANPKEKRRDVIGSLSIGEVYHFHGLRYTCRDGFLWISKNSFAKKVDKTELENFGRIKTRANTINSEDLNMYDTKDYIMANIELQIKEIFKSKKINSGKYTQTHRKIRLADEYRSNVFFTFWNSQVAIPDKYKLNPGDWINVRNFKANKFGGCVGLVYKQGSTEIRKIPENQVSPGKSDNVNMDWENNANTFVIGKVMGIKDIRTLKKCTGSEKNDEGCGSVYKSSTTSCRNDDCKKGPFRKSRFLEEKYSFVLSLLNEEGTRFDILTYKKTVDHLVSRPRVYGESLEEHVKNKFSPWSKLEKVEIGYWTRAGDDDWDDVLIFESLKDLSTDDNANDED